jgi:hypothetical protein
LEGVARSYFAGRNATCIVALKGVDVPRGIATGGGDAVQRSTAAVCVAAAFSCLNRR